LERQATVGDATFPARHGATEGATLRAASGLQ
jgi:hypothetical protein